MSPSKRSRTARPGKQNPDARTGIFSPLRRSDTELLGWALGGLIVGVVIGVTTLVAFLIMIILLAAIARLYLEKTERNIRPSLGMVPVFIGTYSIGLFLRALGG